MNKTKNNPAPAQTPLRGRKGSRTGAARFELVRLMGASGEGQAARFFAGMLGLTAMPVTRF
jgi:hypothetical protein